MESLQVSNGPRFVRKRDNKTTQFFDISKIEKAIRSAWGSIRPGLVDEDAIRKVVGYVCLKLSEQETTDIERIQTEVGYALMDVDKEIAEAYITYKSRRSEQRSRRKAPDISLISDYIHSAKYARYMPELSRREVFSETVSRVMLMHLKRFPQIKQDIVWAFDRVLDKEVFPSMRAMQFAGEAIEQVNSRQYNCSYTLIDRVAAFKEALYLLLCGCGVGFSVQKQHVAKLPKMATVNEGKVSHYTIQDSIAGWADALDELFKAHIEGYYVEFNYSLIRPAGSILKTSGGRAPGHLGLKRALDQIRGILTNAAGRQLRTIEAYDVLCHAADAVLSGGIRRSAMIALFSIDDDEMMNAKASRDWHSTHGWRENSNNSVAAIRGSITKEQFVRIFEATKTWGEPGVVFVDHPDYGVNPCAEIGMDPVLTVDESNIDELLAKGVQADIGDRLTGYSFCNLTEVNASKLKSFEDFERAARAAAIIGTLQAAYTEFPYLGVVSECIAKRDALIGVSMTGMMDSPEIACNPEYQRAIAKRVIEVNKEFAAKIGINFAARSTCVKPAGTSSLAWGAIASGHHLHHARRYFRRVTANYLEPVFQYFKQHNEHMCVRKPNGDYAIEFVVEAPPNALLKNDMSAVQFLESVRSTQINWVIPGTARNDISPGLTHNVSNTVQVREHEWDEVGNYLYDNQNYFTGVSLLPDFADKQYQFAPNEAITTDADEKRWNEIIELQQPVDYQLMVELEDGTTLKGEIACANGKCEISL